MSHFVLKIEWNLRYEYLYDNCKNKILLSFIVKIVIKNTSVKFNIFWRWNDSNFFQKEALTSESINILQKIKLKWINYKFYIDLSGYPVSVFVT